MREIEHAIDLLNRGENAVVIFTRDLEFKYDRKTGTGSTGNWLLNPNRMANVGTVIIYNRPDIRMPATIYKATFCPPLAPSTRSDEPDRHTVNFSGCSIAGISRSKWPKFAETGTNAIRYLSK